ncbi:MAG: Foldase protein PrsA [Candidatus Gottesmanbacteria bacterium GW2011_GWA2_41_12]|uniref:Foldase protein PrsA n=3 Tax=Candidatus Gottesmaniibacteriota TaxID=1752720 RepID=A0A0G0WVE2_9BACT|nr:MAG: Foldase protein PrsA [Candidatus Gottesmanbacteria bacterium GW2011_GWA2_41_12]
MPAKKSTKKSPGKNTRKTPKISTENMMPTVSENSAEEKKRNVKPYILIAVLLLAGVLLYKNKGLFIAGIVNGKPISAFQLNKALNDKYGKQTLEMMIDKQIILDAAAQKGVRVISKDVDNKEKELEKSLNGKVSLTELLKNQGLTKSDFRDQLLVRLTIEKLFSNQATVSDKEIDDFLTKNKDQLGETTDSAKLRQTAIDNIKQQKIAEEFDKWFADAKQKAKVTEYR